MLTCSKINKLSLRDLCGVETLCQDLYVIWEMGENQAGR
jgi:hypothetical protein